jgi:hypothetical protein
MVEIELEKKTPKSNSTEPKIIEEPPVLAPNII